MMGRPLKFESVEQLKESIDFYFSDTPKEQWTVTGLALALNTYRDVLMDYHHGKYDEEDRDFSNTIKRAKEMIHNVYELDLRLKGRSSDIFALKNFGWRDQQNIDHTNKGDKFESIKELILATNENRREEENTGTI